MRTTPFPAPLNCDQAEELGQIIGSVMAISLQAASALINISVRRLAELCLTDTAVDAVTGEFLKANEEGHPPAESAERACRWFTGAIVSVAKQITSDRPSTGTE
ncbi:hypothetical protein [Streptomyces sp. NBC_01500]|uniref:hypothetical protein n=1 Tax=Streptomyces sp. NBC_01500 TaxID=2903886 RepID=UPI00224E7C2D|nr:hypothetical protein [Streptomyces sp. NBC_01500]MCX4554211.1 hypothetical protein [Streptomyces sp. NBC_01500]